MSGQKSSYLENAFLRQMFAAVAGPSPATVYLALFTTLPAPAGGVEATGGGYARLAIPCDGAHWTVTGNVVTNAVEFDMFTASGTVSGGASMVGFGLYDSLAGGNLLFYGPVALPQTLTTGQVATFAVGQITLTET